METCLRRVAATLCLASLVCLFCASGEAGEEKAAPSRPAVLVVGSVHADYVAKPLHALGVNLDTCAPGEVAKRLASELYQVLVLPSQVSPGLLKEAEAFLQKGGGVFCFNPGGSYHHTKDWLAYCEWLAGHGARPRWEASFDDKALVDSMRQHLSFTDRIEPPFDEDVEGLLVHVNQRREHPLSFMSFDLSDDWMVVVRGADTLRTERPNDTHEYVQPWIPEKGLAQAPPIMATRILGKGRLCVVGLRTPWTLASPQNCPTAKTMLSEGLGETPSQWNRVFANAFSWLAEPAQALGWGGMRTPKVVVDPPVKVWPDHPPIPWGTEPLPGMPSLADRPQTVGLVGARTALSGGSGTVADYAKAARDAGLQYIVFLEDGLKLDQTKWDALVKECAAASDDRFGAIPGLTYEDAQGNHFFAIGDGVRFPEDKYLLPDRRLDTTTVSRTEAVFAWILQRCKYDLICGYWNHAQNELHQADYKLQNSWCLFTRDAQGQVVDDAFDEFMYWQALGGCHTPFAFELMDKPAQVAKRAREGWKVVSTVGGVFGDGTYTKENPVGVTGMRQRWAEGNAWYPPYQYLTEGPRILAWETQNCCVVPSGEWWRPDLAQYRVRLHVASDAGLKEVVIHEGDRRIFRRFLPGGSKNFEHTMVLTNCQQRDLVVVVTDTQGKRAISMELWNRNTLKDQFICGDRCNFLGRSALRLPDGRGHWTPTGFRPNLGVTPSKGQMDLVVMPDISLTLDTPTLPIDGRPIGAPQFTLHFQPGAPGGELPLPFAMPSNYLIGPEIGVGQGNYVLGYDPSENGAKQTRLGHPYQNPEKQGHIGRNAWTSWYRLLPLRKVNGWARIYAPNWLPTELRTGWFELKWQAIDSFEWPEEGLQLAYFPGACEVWQAGNVLAAPGMGKEGAFSRGTYATTPTGMIIALDDQLTYRYDGKIFRLFYRPEARAVAKGDAIHLRVGFAGTEAGTPKAKLHRFAKQVGVAAPGTPGYAPTMQTGEVLDTYFNLRLAAETGGVAFSLPQTTVHGFLTAQVEGLNDHWSVHLLDRARDDPNHRGLPVRDGIAYAMLDLNEAAQELFAGHPVTCQNQEARIAVAWKQDGLWAVEVNNPTDEPMELELVSNPDWSLFDFRAKVTLAPGTGKAWEVKEK